MFKQDQDGLIDSDDTCDAIFLCCIVRSILKLLKFIFYLIRKICLTIVGAVFDVLVKGVLLAIIFVVVIYFLYLNYGTPMFEKYNTDTIYNKAFGYCDDNPDNKLCQIVQSLKIPKQQ